jgi:hypothetical protein
VLRDVYRVAGRRHGMRWQVFINKGTVATAGDESTFEYTQVGSGRVCAALHGCPDGPECGCAVRLVCVAGDGWFAVGGTQQIKIWGG